MRVLRVYHGGRDAQHRCRERALAALGVDVRLVVPAAWPGRGAQAQRIAEPFGVVELAVRRAGDVNRHVPADAGAIRRLLDAFRPDVLDLHEEPFSLAARRWLRAAPPRLPVVMYSAQNIDKRLPPPFAAHERAALARVSACYPCSRQAAAVLRGKGFAGAIEVVPLGYDETAFFPGEQSVRDGEVVLTLVGRLVAEKGVEDAVRVLARVTATRPARLLVCGNGPYAHAALILAASLGVADRVEMRGWQQASELAAIYRETHVLLVPSSATSTWVEQFGRVIVEAQACGAVVAGYASGAIPEVAGPAGVLVGEGERERLADAVVAVLTDADAWERRRADGARQAAARTWGAVAQRQRALYEAARGGIGGRRSLPRAPRARRGAAHAEFGPTALTPAGARPFAVPLLRRGGAPARALGASIDATAEALARWAP